MILDIPVYTCSSSLRHAYNNPRVFILNAFPAGSAVVEWMREGSVHLALYEKYCDSSHREFSSRSKSGMQ